MGDFNLPSVSWNDVAPYENDSASDSMFLDLFHILGLHQCVLEPTFISFGNILDLILTTDPDRIQQVSTFPPFPHCGHVLVKASYLFQDSLLSDKVNKTSLDWARGNFGAIRNALRLFDWEYELLHLNIDDATTFLTSIVSDTSSSLLQRCQCCLSHPKEKKDEESDEVS